jgi:hypothetical protein
MVVPSFTIGVLGQAVFDLGFVDATLVIIFFNLLSVLTVCFFSTFGAAFGLRQMVLSRFYFGWWGVKLSRFLPPLHSWAHPLPLILCSCAIQRPGMHRLGLSKYHSRSPVD